MTELSPVVLHRVMGCSGGGALAICVLEGEPLQKFFGMCEFASAVLFLEYKGLLVQYCGTKLQREVTL